MKSANNCKNADELSEFDFSFTARQLSLFAEIKNSLAQNKENPYNNALVKALVWVFL